MRRVSSEVHIAADPGQVWSVLTDLDRFSDWNPFLIRAAGRIEPGARLELRFRLPTGRQATFRPTVLAVESGRLLRWRGRLGVPGLFDGVHSFELNASDGGTRVLQSERFSGLLLPVGASVIAQIELGFAALNDALKAQVETRILQGRL